MKPLYPWFGGKAMVADRIWEALGNPAHYLEPCYGGGAVHLARPHPPIMETLNDTDHYIVNFLRAAKHAPAAVAQWAAGPVIEADLHARHQWLIAQEDWHARMTTDPHYYDAQIAGWWLWGICCWIGSGWCEGDAVSSKRPHLSHVGQGVLAPARQIHADLHALATRLSSPQLRICCGDWRRVCTPAVLNALDTQSLGIFLDPPYNQTLRNPQLYRTDTDPAQAIAAWARSIQDRPNTRIVLCGYVGEHDMPGWQMYRWQANGGYRNTSTGRGRANARQECLWLSPQCHVQGELF